MPGKISPSIMCADFFRLEAQIREIEEAQAEYIHVDIMDGRFVPNFALGPDFVQQIRNATEIPLDIHLMVEQPERHLDLFNIQPGDIVSVHVEASVHLQRTLQMIRDFGARPGVALNPATSLESIEYVLGDADVVLVMTVNPGFAGQRLVPATLDKIARLKSLLARRGLPHVEIEVDGNVSFDNAVKMRAAGADVFVAGTSSLFRPGEVIPPLAEKLRACIV